MMHFKKNTTVGRRIFSFLFTFSVLILIVLWLTNIVFLDEVYKAMKHHEIARTANVIASNIESDKLGNLTDYLFRQKNMTILILGKDGRILREDALSFADDFRGKHINPRIINELYGEAKKNGGVAYRLNSPTYNEFSPGNVRDNPFSENRPAENIIYAKLVKFKGEDALIVLSGIISPVDATVNTLIGEFLFIAIFIIFLAGIFAVIIAKKVTIPISRINDSAKLLASGNYDIKFKGSGLREIKELSDTLNYAARELSKVEGLRRELLANVSHDLRTPLTMITGYSEVMRDIPGEYTPENVQIIIDESKRLTDLVNDIMDISKLEGGEQSLELSEFNITSLVLDVMKRYKKLIKQDGYNIAFDYSEEAIVSGDKTKLTQVIYNLVNNAIHYCGEDKKITVRQTIADGFVRFDVIDRGEGISPEDLPYIWDRYFKSRHIHKRAVVGTGLGLSIVKNILELHGAEYGVESREGKGSDFWFKIKVI